MPNKPTFVILWLSFQAIGVAPAFINYNLTGESLKHCISISGAETVLFDPDVEENVSKVEKELDGKKLYLWLDGLSKAGEGERSKRPSGWTVVSQDSYRDLDSWTLPHKPHREGIQWKTPIVYIFTSGTSGMPKMAPCSQAKYATAALTWCRFANWSKSDIVYTPLPLYHSSAAFLCVGAAIARGSTVALSRK
jgi:acyl-CoA synthetase (AMP-forming)/AMP-acid ligase II